MVQIWQMEPYPCGDPRLPHHVFPPKLITPDDLSKRTGTLYWKSRVSRLVVTTKTELCCTEHYANDDLS
uniref:Uncharacterized protein n=1 Tax=Heterorhabditis bacteriophora TaxID=37862 RepID=A0A1I7XPM5_HETBA